MFAIIAVLERMHLFRGALLPGETYYCVVGFGAVIKDGVGLAKRALFGAGSIIVYDTV
jgi:hypothetical protein